MDEEDEAAIAEETAADDKNEKANADTRSAKDKEKARKDKETKANGGDKKKPPTSSRFDELSTPNKRIMLALWDDHGHLFNEERRRAMKLRLEELYAMTPEQAEAYFAQQQKQLKRKEKEAKMKKKLMKMKKEEMEIHERQRAYRLFEKYLVKSFKYACAHTPPPLVTERVRQLSDIILEHLCDMCNADVPDRSEDTDRVSKFYITIADWIAIEVERAYFEVQVQKNRDLEEIEVNEKILKAIELEKEAQQENEQPKDMQQDSILSKEVKVEELEVKDEPKEVNEEPKTEPDEPAFDEEVQQE